MTRNNRLVLLGLAAIVLIVAIVAIGTQGDDKQSASTTSSTPTTTSSEPDTQSSADTEATPEPTPTPDPTIKVVVKDKQPVGGVKEIEVTKGDRVRFNVISDEAENVHLHGYDVEKPVAPGEPAKFDFKAKIDGVYEVELEEAAVQIISLRVNP